MGRTNLQKSRLMAQCGFAARLDCLFSERELMGQVEMPCGGCLGHRYETDQHLIIPQQITMHDVLVYYDMSGANR